MPSPEEQRRTDALLAWGAFGVLYLATYFLSTALPTPLLWYYPVEHQWAFETHARGLAADYYGRVLLSTGVGALGGLACRGILPRLSPDLRRRGLRPLLAWSAVLLVFTSALYIFLLEGRQPFAAPLPPGYERR